MTVGKIDSVNLGNLDTYAAMTQTHHDDKAMVVLNEKIMAAVPDATPQEIADQIDQIKAANPEMTMDQVFETAVKSLNPQCDADAINEIRSAWQTFVNVSNLSGDDIKAILKAPIEFSITNSADSETSIKQLMAMLMRLMIEIAGEESASQLLEGCQQRDEIEKLAKEKAGDMRVKAWTNLAVGLVSAGCQGVGALGSGIFSGAGVVTYKNSSLSQSLGGVGGAINSMGQAGSTATNAVGSLFTGLTDAEIAIKEGKSQTTSINKETADKMRQKATELLQACMQLLQSMSQADYQTMTTIGRV